MRPKADEVDAEKTQGVDSADNVKHIERNNQSVVERMMLVVQRK